MEKETKWNGNRISELPKHVADKIAAGEVVDRPLSIVKELVENSIDAGANSVIVEIKNGGKTYIRVTDNGVGIEKEDAELAFKRHATSKIRTDNDLNHIESLGFRGEALASIAAVSRVELITKTQDEKSGIRIKIEGGMLVEKEDTGCPEGTTILIEDLFFNTPARLKFMKQDATESTLIIDFISKVTLAYPEIKFRLINNGNILFSTNGKGDIYSNILTIYSKEIGSKLIHLKEEEGHMSLEAYVSSPDNSRTNRKSQIFFVNGRYISSKIMEHAVADAYLEKLFEGRYPIVFLFLRVAADKLDVNIHPNKKEVRFDDERAVRDFIAASIRKNLQTKEAIPEIKEKNLFQFRNAGPSGVRPGNSGTEPVRAEEMPASQSAGKITNVSVLQPKSASIGKKPIEEQVDIKKLLSEKRQSEVQSSETQAPQSDDMAGFTIVEPDYTPAEKTNHEMADGKAQIQEAETAYISDAEKSGHMNLSDETLKGSAGKLNDFQIDELQVTGSIFGTYITAVDETSFYLIDQHAAHERIFYEQLLEEYQKREKTQQLILTPIIVNVTYAVKNDTGGMLHFLGNLGFEIEEFGPTSYIVKAIPYYMDMEEAKDFIDYLLDNISEEAVLENQKKIGAIITSACKKAVKAHDVLDRREIDRLMADLAKTRNPYSCPHGRPTFIRMKKYEIEKMFKRV